MKFKQLFVRGISLWTNYLVHGFSKSSKNVIDILEMTTKEGVLSTTKLENLFYKRFKASVLTFQPTVIELESRIDQIRVPKNLLKCHKAYCDHRLRLLKVMISKSEILQTARDLMDYLRTVGEFLTSTCAKEFSLHYELFDLDVATAVRSNEGRHLESEFDLFEAQSVISERSSRSKRSRFSQARSVAKEYRKNARVPENDYFGQMMSSLTEFFYRSMRPLLLKIVFFMFFF